MLAQSIFTCGRCLALRHRGISTNMPVVQAQCKSFKNLCKRMMSSVANEPDEDIPRENLKSERLHVSVLADKVVEILNPRDGQVFVDMTFGAGGHTKQILEEAPGCKIFCLDQDPLAFKIAMELSKEHKQITPIHGKFSQIHEKLHRRGIGMSSVDGILFDVGTSSMQFDIAERGFAISKDSELDMRMDTSDPDQITAADVVNSLSEHHLCQIIKKYGEEKNAREIARAIVDSRNAFGKILTTKQLSKIVQSATGIAHKSDKLQRPSHSATKTFQAIRIFVNDELNEINNGFEIAWHLLKPGGVCVAICFHSLEDRIVKRHFHGIHMDAKFNMSLNEQAARNFGKMYSQKDIEEAIRRRWEPFSKKIVVPDADEVIANPRSRSAKLRAARKISKE